MPHGEEGVICYPESCLLAVLALEPKGVRPDATHSLARAPSLALVSCPLRLDDHPAAGDSEGCGQERVNLQRLSSAAWRAPKAHRLGTWAPTSVGGAET